MSFGSSNMIEDLVVCREATSPTSRCLSYPVERVPFEEVGPGSPKCEAALQLQKVYKSFRTRRKLADCAVLVEQRWWKLLDFAMLKRSSISFFDISKQETAISRWSRARTRAAKVGKGLSKDKNARKLALQHWLEAIDPRHRYGHNLHFYYDCWLGCDSRQPFFYWLDVGEGRDCDLHDCPRSKLQQQCIKYLGPKEREAYEVIVEDGKFLYKQSRQFVDTSEAAKIEPKWIFVLSTMRKLYVGQKKKGTFQHSSFLAGGATSAAGRLEVTHGILQAIWPHSGHYKPTEENFQELIHFLEENNVNLTDVKNSPIDEEEAALIKQSSCKGGLRRDSSESDLVGKATKFEENEFTTEPEKMLKQSSIRRRNVTISIPDNTPFLERLKNESEVQDQSSPCISPMAASPGIDKSTERATPSEGYMSPKWTLFDEDQEQDQNVVPEESILRRIMSKKGLKSYQLGKQLSSKWTTGAGPRIGCMRDYPVELQSHVLEKMNLSPKSSGQSRIPCCSSQNSLLVYSSGCESSVIYSSPRCLNCPSSLSLSYERSNSFHNSYSIQC